MKANRKYKDSVFTRYFSEDPRRLVELYNALEDTDYPENTPVQITTLEDILYKDRINDISFLLDGQLVVLVEHQSTINENMAVRMLIYLGRLYEKIIPTENLYKSRLFKIPTPKFVVLYNGTEECPQHYQQRLSDSFAVAEDLPAMDLVVDIWNVNYEENAKVVQECRSLRDYSQFIEYVRERQKAGVEIAEAIADAVRRCQKENIMQEFLSKNASEVENMLMTEWNWDTAFKVREEEAQKEGGIKMLCKVVAEGAMSLASALTVSGFTKEEFVGWMHKFYPDYKI